MTDSYSNIRKLIEGHDEIVNEVLHSNEGILVLVYDGEIGCSNFKINYAKFSKNLIQLKEIALDTNKYIVLNKNDLLNAKFTNIQIINPISIAYRITSINLDIVDFKIRWTAIAKCTVCNKQGNSGSCKSKSNAITHAQKAVNHNNDAHQQVT